VIGLRTWQIARPGAPQPAFPTAETAEEAVRLALELAIKTV
jgi:hypothetical protein